jgi:hypothetical protein
MIKRDKNFRLPKTVKTQMAFILDREKRNGFKNAMIEAIVKGSVLAKSKKQKEATVDEE